MLWARTHEKVAEFIESSLHGSELELADGGLRGVAGGRRAVPSPWPPGSPTES